MTATLTPVVLGMEMRRPTAADIAAWHDLNLAGRDWYRRVVGAAPAIEATRPLMTSAVPSGPNPYPPTFEQAMGLVRSQFGDGLYSVMGLGVGQSGGYGHPQSGCLLGEQTLRTWQDPPAFNRSQTLRACLWILLHEWGHIAGLAHPADTARTDSIMAYGSTAPFERGAEVGFLPAELAAIQANPLWEESYMPDPTGWMPGVVQIPATEWGYADIREDDMWPKAVVNHIMQGYRATMDGWARSPQPEGVSVQFGLRRDGEIAQYVSIWNPAYHAGDVNKPDDWGAVMLGRYGPNPNKWSIGIEWEGFSKDPIAYPYDFLYDQGNPYPEAMIQAGIEIHRFIFRSTQELMDEPRKEDRVLTHNQLNGATRAQDPGDYWIATVKPRIAAVLRGERDPGSPVIVPVPPGVPVPVLDARIPQARDLLSAVIEGR